MQGSVFRPRTLPHVDSLFPGFFKPTVTWCLARPAFCFVLFFEVQRTLVCLILLLSLLFYIHQHLFYGYFKIKFQFLWLGVLKNQREPRSSKPKKCLIERSDFFLSFLSLFSLSLSLSCEKFSWQIFAKCTGCVLAGPRGWRTDWWWPHSPRRTTFQLVLIVLCVFVRATRTRTPVYFLSSPLPPCFLYIFFVFIALCFVLFFLLIALNSLPDHTKHISRPHKANKVIQREGGTAGFCDTASLCKLLPLSERHWERQP